MKTAFVIFLAAATTATATEPKRPNILWIVVDDMSANFGCYGEKLIETPNVDRLAKEGTLFSKAFVTAPVCSPCRSALITGCYQTTIGAHHHRSGRGELKITLPGEVVPVPMLFQKAGYYTANGDHEPKGNALGKTDYNFEWARAMYDGNTVTGRKAGQPFFAQIQLHGGKHRGQKANPKWHERVKAELGSNTKPERAVLPPYYPRDPVMLADWADYLDCCRWTDLEVGDIVKALTKANLLDDTIICFMTDHGISHARGKQFLYDEGIHVPLIIRGPGIKAGVRTDLVSHIDLAATSLAFAGLPVPKWMQGQDLFHAEYKSKDAVYSARDRCDETVDHLRSVRTDKYKYIRNYLNQRPHLQPCRYKDSKAIVEKLRELHEAKKLDELQEKLLFAPTRPAEELYDLAADPHELHNLAAHPKHQPTLLALRKKITDWEIATDDKGCQPEQMAMYDSDMKVYVGEKSGNEVLRKTIELNKLWIKEGK